jgi:RNA polymerase sigma factor (sigma-70 family)
MSPAFRTPEASGRSSESVLVSAAQAGDEDAFEALVASHLDVAYRIAYLLTGSAADAQDAVQDALVKAWLALDRFRVGAPVRPWLLRIVTNEAHNRRRTAGRQAGLALQLSQMPEGSAPGADAVVAAGEQRERLCAAVAALRIEDQLVIAARYFAGLSEAEAATMLSLRPGTVKSRLSRALARLREALGESA